MTGRLPPPALLALSAAGLMLCFIPNGAGATCSPTGPAGTVTLATSFGAVVAPGQDDAAAAARAGEVARAAARRYLRLSLPPFLIASPGATSIQECGFLFPWSFPSPGPHGPILPSHVLPHEIGHAVFIRFVMPRTRPDEYGGDAPDWLDEMAALAFEDDAGVASRRAEARRLASRGELIPLTRLLRMSHPEWAAGRRAATAGGAPAGQPASVETPAFYATVRALLDFLVLRTGDEGVVRSLADQIRAGAPVEDWILLHAARDARDGLAGIDADVERSALAWPVRSGALDPDVSTQVQDRAKTAGDGSAPSNPMKRSTADDRDLPRALDRVTPADRRQPF